MPKTYKRRKTTARTNSGQPRAAGTQARSPKENTVKMSPASNATASNTNTANRSRPFFSPRVTGPQSLILPAMVAAGCWLMAYTVIFLTSDTNRNLVGGLAAMMALLWTFSFGMRVRKLLLMRQRPGS